MKANLGRLDEKNKARQKYLEMQEQQRNCNVDQLFRKGWSGICKSVIQTYRYYQRSETEQNCKKIAQMCIKETKKKSHKNKKYLKEYGIRAKKLFKEVMGYWKKKNKQMNELRKKKEKLEIEIKKREEEQLEQ